MADLGISTAPAMRLMSHSVGSRTSIRVIAAPERISSPNSDAVIVAPDGAGTSGPAAQNAS